MRLLNEPKVSGHRILVEIEDVKNALKTDRIQIPEEILNRENMRGQASAETGKVIAIGPDAFVREGATEPYCIPGDQIIFVQYAGQCYRHPVSKKMYRIINPLDVLAVVGVIDNSSYRDENGNETVRLDINKIERLKDE